MNRAATAAASTRLLEIGLPAHEPPGYLDGGIQPGNGRRGLDKHENWQDFWRVNYHK